MSRFATTLASQLASTSYWMHRYIKAAVDAEPSLLASSTSLKVQLDRLVYQPFQYATWWRFTTWWRFLTWRRFTTVPFVIVIDGLDECEDKQGVEDFIDSMLEYFGKNPSTLLRFFITTRVEQHIQSRLKDDEVHLEDLAAHGSRNDIILFLRHSFGLAAKRDSVIEAYIQEYGDWPNQADSDTLVVHIDGSFIFASALSKYIIGPTNDNLTPMQRLPLALNMNPGLDGLYSQTLTRSQDLPHFFDIVTAIALLEEPLPIASLAELLGLKNYQIIHVLVDLQAIIQLPGTDEDKPITLCHTSLRDFLMTETRSRCFFAPPRFHIRLAYLCFSLQFSKAHSVDRATEANRDGLNYAIKYGHVHWARYWEKQSGDLYLEDVRARQEGGLQHELFLALGFVQSLVGMPTLRPSIRECMTLNWLRCLASAVDLDPSGIPTDRSLMKIAIGYPLQKVTEPESPVDNDGVAFSVSAHLFDALTSNVELAARSIRSKIRPYSSLSLSRIVLSQVFPPWERGNETKSIVLALRAPWRDFSLLDIFEMLQLAVQLGRNFFLQASFELAAKGDPVIQTYIGEHGDWPTKSNIDGSFAFASALLRYILGPTNDSLTRWIAFL
ncbi:hypothetical protein EST38_g5667 [Candolleomyces aberdarensis]|uniref:Nephrocystin 3-like N-terminal domain-containing protein n=1 Tax=Candolleomyces aberdarensis TaxID=2316362 RepID=A0A4Q2DJY3_9AGAR|nr:hypothetical protein EST38_g5667 [Candolleomyces aberdarensis]